MFGYKHTGRKEFMMHEKGVNYWSHVFVFVRGSSSCVKVKVFNLWSQAVRDSVGKMQVDG